MISANLKGRLGNMMFQIASVHSLAVDNNTTCKFIHQENSRNGSSSSKYSNSIFKNVDFTLKNYAELTQVYVESYFEYKAMIYKKNTLYDGYFQSERYFYHNREAILDLFNLNDKYEEIDDVIAVHVRRGDYLDNSTIHTDLWKTNYYLNAFKYFGKEKSYKIFSDDIAWCKNNIELRNVEFSENISDVSDLTEFKKHTNKIIANSSFSWWASWVSKNNGFVVAPEKWFEKNGPARWSTIYCDGWKII